MIEVKDVLTVAASVVSSIGAGAWVSAIVTGRMAKHREELAARRTHIANKLNKTESIYSEALGVLHAMGLVSQVETSDEISEWMGKDIWSKYQLVSGRLLLLCNDDLAELFSSTWNSLAEPELKNQDVFEERFMKLRNAMQVEILKLETMLENIERRN